MIFGAVLLTLSLFVLVFAFVSKKNNKDDKEEVAICNKAILICGIIAIIGLIIMIVFYVPNSNKGVSKEGISACNNLSDTYKKCHWSALENRCVCKYR